MAQTASLKKEIIHEAKKELARRDFFFYCKLMAGDFYKDSRDYLIDLCRAFQDFLKSDEDILVVNVPP